MFTVLSKTRNSNLYLIAALMVMAVVLFTFAVIPSISAPGPAAVTATDLSGARSDYHERHPELKMPGVIVIDATGDFFLRHPEWAGTIQTVAIPVTGSAELSDYFERHSELRTPAESTDVSDYFQRH